jgi:PTS system cellobiose-specific IIA component
MMIKEQTADTDAVNSTALEIIMSAGDARLSVSNAVKSVAAGDFAAADKELEEAKKKLAAAHGLQTEIIQSEGEGQKREHTLLFIHAQDTLMTIYSEMNMVRQLKTVFARYEEKIAALERRFENGQT